jgi:hypothetical protein
MASGISLASKLPLNFPCFRVTLKAGVFAMCTVTLELSDELVAIAEKQGLLTPSALEAYIRKSLDNAVFPPSKEAASRKPAPLNETLGKIWALCKDSTLTVDRFLEMQHKDKELEDKLDPWTTPLMPVR